MKQGDYWPYNLKDKPISKTYEEKAKEEAKTIETKAEQPVEPKVESNEDIKKVISMINEIPDLPKANIVNNDDDLDWVEDWDDAIDNIN